MAITAPYNFVPLNGKVFIPSWYDKVSQDIPFEDGEDGYIEVAWKNVSPLFVRDCSESSEKADNIHSMHILQPDGKRLYFIPGSTLKGMLRSVLAIMSFGKMTDYNNSYFGHREFNTKLTEGKKYQQEMGKVKYGWLHQEDDDYYLSPCIEEADKISIEEVQEEYGPNYDDATSAWERNEIIGKNTFPTPKGKTGYRLFATGRMHNKKHELLIPEATGKPIKLKPEEINSFFFVYEPTSGFENYKKMLEQGKMIPVSYINDACRGYILGMGRMMRYPYKQSVRSLVEKEQPKVPEGQRDLCETIFGWADKTGSMKGRVQVGNAFATRSIADSELPEPVSGVLGQPKASFYPLYLKQDKSTGRYYTYDSDEARISGRKRYRIHRGGTTTDLPQGNDNENTKTRLCPVSAGQTFVMRINVHNLRKMEIGALLSAITFHHTKNVWHNVGGAKSFGYGKIECSSIELHGLKYDEEEYLREFEKKINAFANNWNSSPQMTALIAIASEHDDDDVKMMELPDYTDYKENTNFSQLQDTSKGVQTMLSEEDFYKGQHADEYAAIETFYKNGEFSKACDALDLLIKRLQMDGISDDEEQEKLNTIKDEMAKAEAKAQQDADAAQKAEIEARLKEGLAATLDECYPEGTPNAGQYKVQKWKPCLDKIVSWMKKAEETHLTPDEQDALEQTIIRLMSTTDKKERKPWSDFNNARWKKISELLSPERAEQIFNRQQTK